MDRLSVMTRSQQRRIPALFPVTIDAENNKGLAVTIPIDINTKKPYATRRFQKILIYIRREHVYPTGQKNRALQVIFFFL